jgi:hypothetical protein
MAFKEASIGDDISVGKQDDVTAGLYDAAVAGSGPAAIAARKEADSLRIQLFGELMGAVAGAGVAEENLILFGRQSLVEQTR